MICFIKSLYAIFYPRLIPLNTDSFNVFLSLVRETDPNYETFHWMQVMTNRKLYKESRVLPKDLNEA